MKTLVELLCSLRGTERLEFKTESDDKVLTAVFVKDGEEDYRIRIRSDFSIAELSALDAEQFLVRELEFKLQHLRNKSRKASQ